MPDNNVLLYHKLIFEEHSSRKNNWKMKIKISTTGFSGLASEIPLVTKQVHYQSSLLMAKAKFNAI